MIHALVKEGDQTTQRQFVREFLRELEQTPDDSRWLAAIVAQKHAQQRHTRMSYQEFLEWADEDTCAEWVNGEVMMSSPASLPH